MIKLAFCRCFKILSRLIKKNVIDVVIQTLNPYSALCTSDLTACVPLDPENYLKCNEGTTCWFESPDRSEIKLSVRGKKQCRTYLYPKEYIQTT